MIDNGVPPRSTTGTTSYSYSPEGWLIGRGFSIGGATYALGYGYNALGQLASVVYPDGNQTIYSYTQGVVSSVMLNVGGSTVSGASAITYQPMNAGMNSWTASNGLVNTINYDTDGRVTGIGAGSVQSLIFNYDAANRIVGINNDIDGTMSENLGYDDESRLVSVYSGADIESFHYDADGNRLTSGAHGVAVTYTSDVNSNRLLQVAASSLGTVPYGYDAQGNTTTTNGAVSNQYNPFNRMTNAGGASFYVNPEGQRLRKSGGSTGTTYFAPDSGGALMAEDDNGSWVDYVRLNGRLIGRISAGQVDAIQADQVDRPETVTDASRNIVWHAQNYPFDSSVTQATITLNLGFPGQYYDAETWLWNNGYRDYSAGFGRYVESDPIGLGGGVNTYAYVDGNPLSNVDPMGLEGSNYALYFGGITSQISTPPSTLCEKDALANFAAQITPGVGLGLALSGDSFSPFESGPWFTDSGANAFDVMSGLLGGASSAVTSKAANSLANSYIASSTSDLSLGNKVARRALSSRYSIMWGGTRSALGTLGEALGPIGVLSGFAGYVQTVSECGCGK